MNAVLIRESQEKDLAEITLLQQTLAEEDLIYGFVSVSEGSLKEKLGPYFLVAEVGERIVGFVYGRVQESKGLAVIPQGESYLEVEDIFVKKEFRDQGIGGKLLDQVIKVAKTQGVERLLVYSASKDIDGVLNFYRHHGFKPWYIQMYK